MAAIVSAPSQPVAAAPAAAPDAPGQSDSAIQDPLFQAMVHYVTKGPEPAHATMDELVTTFNRMMESPEGAAYTRALVNPPTEENNYPTWARSEFCSATWTLQPTKILAAFGPSAVGNMSGTATYDWVPASTGVRPSIPGTLYLGVSYNELKGQCDSYIYCTQTTLTVWFMQGTKKLAAWSTNILQNPVAGIPQHVQITGKCFWTAAS